MKRVFLLLASSHLAFGQTTVVTCFDEENDLSLPSIGIIPVEDYQKATTEIDRLKRELDVALRGQAAAEKVGVAAADQRKAVEALRNQLKAANQRYGKALQREQKNFAQREKAMVDKVNAMEKERAKATELFQKQVASLRTDFGRKQGEWERKLMFAEEQRDEAVRKLNEAKIAHARETQAWKQSVDTWRKETEKAVRASQLEEAQKAVANTARLAADWQAERKELAAQVVKLRELRDNENKAWEQSVADWQEKAKQAVRTAQVKEAQDAVANTARLAGEWQTERDALEKQVKEMSAQLAKLEGQLGVQGFEDKQTEVLRLGLAQKSKALEELGADASRLAGAWRAEREDARRELDAMRDLYKSTAKDVKTRDQRIRQLDAVLLEKSEALESLATEASKLSQNWKVQRGGLQKKIAELEEQLVACQKKLNEAVKKEKAAQARAGKVAKEKQGLLTQVEEAKTDDGRMSSKLTEQLAIVADLQGKLGLAKKSEGKLKADLSGLKQEFSKLKKEMGAYQSQKDKDAQALAALKDELKKAKANYAAAERDLAAADRSLKSARGQAETLKVKSQELTKQLDQTQKELAAARKQAEANNDAKVKAVEKEAQVKNLENQLGRLAVAQQELEGTLIATLGDFEKLQKSYLELKAKSAGGGEAAKKAIAARNEAEMELKKLQKKLQGEEAKLEQARKKVEEVEKKQKAAEADAQAGKAALGKCEAELKGARREMGQLQLGQEMLIKEAEALRERFVNIEPVRYQLASANVVAQQQRVLAEVKQVLEVYPNAQFSIKGHTCNLGSEDANLKLSEDRATTLKEFLVQNGIEESRFALVLGCGDTEPQASNETDEGRQKNRRVEIKVIR